LKEESGPLELLEFASGEEKLLYKVHVVTLNEAWTTLNELNTSLKDKLSMSIRKMDD
jgi:hypothetical protein